MHSLQNNSIVARSRQAAGPVPVAARVRTLCVVERGGGEWRAELGVFDDGQVWRGRLHFRGEDEEGGALEVSTADIFIESSEAAVDARARGLGQPLLNALLDSALHTHDRRQSISEDVRRWFRRLLSRNSASLVSEVDPGTEEHSLSRLRSLYDAYRLDQVGHLIALLRPGHFRECVEKVLNGRTIDFGAGDRLQLAMIVVDELERLLPLPPFERWVEDYLSRPDVYHRYTEQLHEDGPLP